MRKFLTMLAVSLALALPAVAQDTAQPAPDAAAEPWLASLITDSPQAGFDLAITMARKAVTTTQTDKDTLHKLRPNYAHDPQSLIGVSGVAATWFATIAAANGYWRE
ncbi:hexameric tyrosine-coordinated heme protein [Paracoccus alkenifer]|uniref:Hexameric tyrosine-coordinated heme protein (HTHP) n=1 Tax=Paracoccus alkenifer TaxID=65735 RepID=A0A1H6LH30_9RHOB|nr:hexameric tyrosine-coordinated heme protein [Paracoccus alkenifer]SEH83879.1 Hexameric tyrosine-coordinated heme protein (HTHP) [Paracoccus alkenifer]